MFIIITYSKQFVYLIQISLIFISITSPHRGAGEFDCWNVVMLETMILFTSLSLFVIYFNFDIV